MNTARLKARLAWALLLRPRLKKWFKRTPEGREAEKKMKTFLNGKREIITLVTGFLVTLATLLGLADWVGPLQKVHEAVQSGDPMVILGAIFGLIMLASRAFKRLAEDRKHEELVEAALETTEAVEDHE